MKSKIKLLISVAMLLTVIAIVSCKKEYASITTEQKSFTAKSYVKYFNAVVNSTSNYLYAEGSVVTGAALAYGSVYPALSPSYMSMIVGSRNFEIRSTTAGTAQPNLAFNPVLELGQYYTIFTYDTLTSPKQKVVTDVISVPTDTTSRVRFANFPYSTVAIPNVDIFSVKRQTNIFSNISLGTVTDFIPYASNLSDTLYVRTTGTTTNLTVLNGLNPTPKRSYTVIFRGSYRSTSGTLARTLSSFLTY